MTRKSTTSQDVAKLAGVSQSTVSYVLTGSRPISESTRKRVEDAILKLDYHPNSGARALRSRRSGVIGLMVPETHENDGVLMTFLAAITREARRSGYDILLVTAHEGAQGIQRVVGTGVCEAMILMELGRHDERIAAVVRSGLPFVAIGKPDEVPGASVVDLDFEKVGRMVVERAVAEGCTDLLLFNQLGRKRHRNDVARFLYGVEESAQGTPLQVTLDNGEPSELPARARELATARGGRTAVFGLGSVVQVLFAFAVAGGVNDEQHLFIAMTEQDLGAISPRLSGTPQIDPHRVEVSTLAVQELVRLLQVEGAHPRVRLVEPHWIS